MASALIFQSTITSAHAVQDSIESSATAKSLCPLKNLICFIVRTLRGQPSVIRGPLSRRKPETMPKLPRNLRTGTDRVGYVCAMRILSRRFVPLALCVLLCGSAWAQDELPLAIRGYDPVAYFTLQRATPGVAQFEYEWDEHRWQFANARHR